MRSRLLTWRIAADYPLVITAFLLSVYGIAMVYSAGQTDVPVSFVSGAYKRQLAWFVIALIAAYAFTRSSIRLLEWMTWPLYGLSVLLLLLTLTDYTSRDWFGANRTGIMSRQ